MNRKNSPYTASITGGGFLFRETAALLPLLQSENSKELLKDEGLNNYVLQMNAETSRKRTIAEVERRYKAMTPIFWNDYIQMNESDQVVALFLVILKTYKIIFDFHINVTMRKWNSITKSIMHDDVMLELNEIAANDEFVDSWAEATKRKVASAYLTILKRIGMLNNESKLQSITCSNFDYYLTHGEAWFLEACLLQPYEIDNIKKTLI